MAEYPFYDGLHWATAEEDPGALFHEEGDDANPCPEVDRVVLDVG